MNMKAVGVLVMVLLSSCGHAVNDAADWREDIGVYANLLAERHIDLYHSIDQLSFANEIARIKASVPTLTTDQTLIELMRLTRSINDGHTSFPLWGWEHSSFPLKLKLLDDSLYVVSTARELSDLLGAKLTAVGGTRSSELVRLLSAVVPFADNQFSTSVRVAELLPNAQVLQGLGVIESQSEALFIFDKAGVVEKRILAPIRTPNLDAQISHMNDRIFSVNSKVSDDLWFGASDDKQTVYVKFRRYTSAAKMEGLAKKLLSFINKHGSSNLIVDLRDNYGGDFFVGLKLAQFLVLADSIDWKNGVFVLIDNATFSAAMSNAAQFSQILNAKLIGEPTGGRPSGYQDMGQFKLPNSGLAVTYSKRLYHFKDHQKDALYPDVTVGVSLEDFKNQTDTQLRWVLSHISDRRKSGDPELQRERP